MDRTNKDTHGSAFSPDRAWILYTRYAMGGSRLMKVPSAGGQPVELARGGDSPGFPIAWSPTNDWIAFSRARELHLVSPDGRTERTLLKNGYRDWEFDRTGGRICGIRRGEGRKWEAWSVEVATGVEHKIVALDALPGHELMSFSLHPDGRRILTTVGSSSSDIWIIDGVLER